MREKWWQWRQQRWWRKGGKMAWLSRIEPEHEARRHPGGGGVSPAIAWRGAEPPRGTVRSRRVGFVGGRGASLLVSLVPPRLGTSGVFGTEWPWYLRYEWYQPGLVSVVPLVRG
jgi:hypothetical protein